MRETEKGGAQALCALTHRGAADKASREVGRLELHTSLKQAMGNRGASPSMHAAKIPAARPHAKSEPSPAFPAFPTRRTKQAVPTARSGCVGTHMKSGHSTMTGITHTHLATQGATYRRERQRGVCARGTFFFARGTVVDAMQQNGVCVLP